MNPLDLLKMSLGSFSGHALRVRLTVLATSVGIASVLLLTSLGQSGRDYVLQKFAGLGSNLLIVVPGKLETSGGPPVAPGRTHELSLDDALHLRRNIPGVVDMAPISIGTMPARVGNKERALVILGSNDRLLHVRRLDLVAGQNLPSLDLEQASPVCLIGSTVHKELFGNRNPLGQTLRLGEYRFRIVGLIAEKGQSLAMDMNDFVLIPVANLMRILNRKGLFRILLSIRSFDEMDTAEEDVRKMLISRHDKEDFTLITQQAVMSSLGDILNNLSWAISGIAAISLLAAGMLITNVMLITVVERRAEIGLCKAIGARNSQILSLFLAEAALLSTAGGVIGVGLGLLGARIIQWLVPALPVSTPVWAIELALAVSFGVGILFGVLPALRASRLLPVEALSRRA